VLFVLLIRVHAGRLGEILLGTLPLGGDRQVDKIDPATGEIVASI
jgi:hypothetical protein